MDFTWKAWWVKDGHKTPESTTPSFAGVVSWDSIQISLTYAALQQVPVCGGDIKNAYLQAPSLEKHFIICGPKFGIENVGRAALICQALYWGKVAGQYFWHHLRECMVFLDLLLLVPTLMSGTSCQNNIMSMCVCMWAMSCPCDLRTCWESATTGDWEY